MSQLLFEPAAESADLNPTADALVAGATRLDYRALVSGIEACADAFLGLGLGRAARVAVYAEKSADAVLSLFGAARAGGVFVPVNPVLKAGQVGYLLRDCNVFVLVTTAPRLEQLATELAGCPDLAHVVLIGTDGDATGRAVEALNGVAAGRIAVHRLDRLVRGPAAPGADVATGDATAYATADGVPRHARHRVIDADMAAILYTSGSTGQPKGVVLSHRNLVAGARSVASYLGNTGSDRILAALPLSFDYGLSQLTTAFAAGSCAVLHNYLLPADLLKALARERITGLAAVPPLWMQLAALDWPPAAGGTLRYFTNSGGAMPSATLAALRARMPKAKPFLMYGLTEAFRSTYLPPEEVDRRPTSIGKAIPNAEILVVRPDGSACAPGEPGELVHRGALVSLGYWNDPVRTAERFRPVPGQSPALAMPEIAVWSGDTVTQDADGFLTFVGRGDEMIKSSGYRISPTEIEEVVYRTGRVAEAVALGIAHPALGQAILLVAQPRGDAAPDTAALLEACRTALPAFMIPHQVDWLAEPLPRNANGKIDRKSLADARRGRFDR